MTVKGVKSEPYESATAEKMAQGFKSHAQCIARELDKYALSKNDEKVCDLYRLHRGPVEKWIEFTRKRLDIDLGELPILNEGSYYDKMIRLADYCSSRASMLTTQRKRKLGMTASLIYEKLLGLPEHRAMQLPEIVKWLRDDHLINTSESQVHQKHLSQLEPWGLQHDKRIGYSITQDREV
jgi:hypothetical protein